MFKIIYLISEMLKKLLGKFKVFEICLWIETCDVMSNFYLHATKRHDAKEKHFRTVLFMYYKISINNIITLHMRNNLKF